MRDARWIIPAALLGLLGSAGASLADEKKIEVEDLPKKVARAAREKFPEAKVVGAAKETEGGETVFEVLMKLDGKSIDLAIDEEGKVREVEKEIEVEDLPRAVIKAAKRKFPEGKIARVEEVSDEDDMVVYELAVEIKGGKTIEVVMSPNGKVMEDEDDGKKDGDDGEGGKKGKGDADKAEKKKPKG